MKMIGTYTTDNSNYLLNESKEEVVEPLSVLPFNKDFDDEYPF